MGAGHAHALYVHEHSPIHHLAPEVKIASALLFVTAVAVTPRQAIWAFGVYAVLVMTLNRLSRVSFGFIAARLLVVLPFLVFALALPFVASGEEISVGGVTVSVEGLWGAWNIVAKSVIGASVSILLAATTEVPDIVRGMGRLRVPRIFTEIAAFMIRYLEVIADELRRMRVSMTARGYDPRWVWQARPIAQSAGALFIRSYERGERVYDAMASRGFTGTMPDLSHRHASRSEWLTASLLPLAGLIVAAAALVMT